MKAKRLSFHFESFKNQQNVEIKTERGDGSEK